MLTGRFARLCFAVGLGLSLIPVLLSAAPTEEAKGKASLNPAERVRNALNQTISLSPDLAKIEDLTLDQFLTYLRDSTKLAYVLDEGAFLDGRYKDVKEVKIKAPALKDVKLKDALRTVLAQLKPDESEATYVVVGDKIVLTTAKHAPYRWMRQPVSLEVEKEELAAALKKLVRETGTNLVLDARAAKEAQTPVSVRLEDVTLETAVVLLAEMVGLRPVRVGNALFLTTKENAAEMRNDAERESLVGPCPLPPEPAP